MSSTTERGEQPAKSPAPESEDATDRSERIYLVPYPKFIFMYPTFFVSLIATIAMHATGRHSVAADDTFAVAITWLFLGVMGINSIVIAFDFPRATSLTMFFMMAAIVLGGILTFTLRPAWFPVMANLLQAIRPVANATFFSVVVVLMGLIYAAVFFLVRFDYWEVRPNELLHHHGMLSDLKRYSAPNLRIDKEVNDVFEYLLLGSGRLILQPSGERRAIILDNVPFISKKEASITKMLGALQVEVRPESK